MTSKYAIRYSTEEERKEAEKRTQRECYRRNREAIRKRVKISYAENRDKILKAQRTYNKRNAEKRRAWQKSDRIENLARWLIYAAKVRAKKQGLEFSITPEDIRIPELCPYLGIPLEVASGKRNHGSPTIDRIDNSKGYTPDNVEVISHRANRLKSDMLMHEMPLMAKAFLNRYKK